MEIPFGSIIYSILGGVVSASQAAQNGLITGCTGVIGATAAHLAFANPTLTATVGVATSVYVFSVSSEARNGVCSLAGRAVSMAEEEIRDQGHVQGGAIALTGIAVGIMTGSIWVALGAMGIAKGVIHIQKHLNKN